MKIKQLLLVDDQDQPIGTANKIDAHLGEAKRHRAFTAIIKNTQNQFLLTQRCLKKPLWPTYWDLSFSSHPWFGETIREAVQRRSQEELGTRLESCKELCVYEYHLPWNEAFSEWEINHIALSLLTASLVVNPDEISTIRWVSWQELKDIWEQELLPLAPWVTLALERLQGNEP